MSILQARSPIDPQRPSRNWIAESLIVAGILAFGYFAMMLETTPQLWASAAPQPAEPAAEFSR